MQHPLKRRHRARGRFASLTRRGVALLMVMIGMIICTLLTAGFLSTQGTSIGIARNERDATKARGIAQTGVDMCFWLIKNKADWRTTMAPGNWLNNVAIGDGTVSASVTDALGGGFSDDNTRAALITSTGRFDNRDFTLIASIKPTGGGTVFFKGNFISGNIGVGGGGTSAAVDSYNSSIGAYNALLPGSNADFVSDSVASSSVLIYFPSVFRGSFTAGPTASLADVIGNIGGAQGPSALFNLTESRNPGTVIFPNTTGLTARGALVWNNQAVTKNVNLPGEYTNLNVTSATVNVTASGIYHFTGTFAVGSTGTSTFAIADGVNAVFVLDNGMAVTNGKIQLNGTARAAFYVKGDMAFQNSPINSGGNTGRLTLFGDAGGGAITLSNPNATFAGAIYAPQHSFTMQNGAPKFFGGLVAQSFFLKNSAAFHFDEALRSLKISNIAGGSAAPGSAEYRLSILGGPGINR